jgi:GAF domain
MDPQGQVRSTSRGRTLVRIFCILLLATFSAGLGLSTVISLWVPFENSGAFFSGDTVSDVERDSPAAKAGLRVGDRFDPKTSFFDRMRIGWYDHPARGQSYTFNVVRRGAPHTITLRTSKTVAAPGWDLGTAEYVLGLIAVLSFVIVGTLLVLLRPTPLTWMFFLFCVGNPASKYLDSIDLLLSLPMPLGFVLNMIRTTLLVIGYVAFVDFALRFPNVRAFGWRAFVERVLPLILLVDLALDYREWFWAFYTVDFGPILDWPYLGAVISLIFVVIALASLLGMYRGSEPREKNRLAWVVAGTLAGYSAVILRDTLIGYLGPGYDFMDWTWTFIAFQIGQAFAPLALAYAIVKHRVIDVRLVLNRALVFACIGAVLAAVLLGLSWTFATFFVSSRMQIVIDFVAIAAITLILRSGYQKLVEIVNAALFPKRQHRIQNLRSLRSIAEEGNFESIQALLTTTASEALGLASAALFIRQSDGGFVRQHAFGWKANTAWHLLPGDASVHVFLTKHTRWTRIDERTWTEIRVPSGSARPALAIPLVSRKKTVGVALYGAHTNDVDVDRDEGDALAELCALAAPALEQREYARPLASSSTADAGGAALTT